MIDVTKFPLAWALVDYLSSGQDYERLLRGWDYQRYGYGIPSVFETDY